MAAAPTLEELERIDEFDIAGRHELNEIFSDFRLVLGKAAQALVVGRDVDTWPEDELLGRE